MLKWGRGMRGRDRDERNEEEIRGREQGNTYR